MHDLTAKRTLVKSPPELWSELSEVDRLARHLDAFGEIKITRLVPEHTVAWEGERASGTVSIEPSGWGTKVTVTAQLEGGAETPGASVEEPAVEETVVEEPVVEEPAAEKAALEAPGRETAAATEAGTAVVEPAAGKTALETSERETAAATEGHAGIGEQPVWEPAVEDPAVEEPASNRSDEPEPSEPAAAEPAEPAEPGQARAPKRRGLLAWLFRPRTAAHKTDAKPDATAPEQAAAGEREPVAAHEAESFSADEPEPVAAGEAERFAADEPEPVAPDEPESFAASEPEPSAANEPEPFAASDPERSAADYPEPSAADELERFAAGDPESFAAGEPGSVTEPGPAFAAEVVSVEESQQDAGVDPSAGAADPAGDQVRLDHERAQAMLDEVLESLGSAHHRPFSRG